ncbi:MAG: hydantoinase/oxoprolinase family protein, partial [Rhodospirillaceae bacterium]|nr:hydantoinase/oxoprolinase family protein [Rhodospirillaceae bacterium]
GGKLARLDVEAARAALARHVGEKLGLGVMEAAEAVIRVANALMAGAIRLVSIERGHDPQRFALMPFGGGGPLHAGALIQDVGLAQAIVPRFPGVTSALGCIVADMRHDFVRTVNRPLDALDVGALDRDAAAFAGEGAALLDRSGIAFAAREVEVEFDMSYVGQTHTVAVPLAVTIAAGSAGIGLAAIRAAFDAAYTRAYGRLLKDVPVRLLNLRVAAIGRRPPFDLSSLKPDAANTLEGARRAGRRLWIGGAWHDTPVFARLDLPAGAVIAGPAVLEQPDTTIIVEPGLAARVDALGNVILERQT